MRAARAVAVAAVLAVAVVAGLLLTGILKPILDRDLTPAAVAVLGEGGDPLGLVVLFPWPEEGFCAGQFSVTARETPTQVSVSQVHDDDPLLALVRSCYGIGTSDDRLAAADLLLQSPLGKRAVVRAVDGARLDVRR